MFLKQDFVLFYLVRIPQKANYALPGLSDLNVIRQLGGHVIMIKYFRTKDTSPP